MDKFELVSEFIANRNFNYNFQLATKIARLFKQ